MFKKVMRILRADSDNLPEPPVENVARLPGYTSLYEQHARENATDQAIGDGDFNHIGRLELSILNTFGLKQEHRLLDFGCGMGRLAVHALQFLNPENYCGVDISATMLERAKGICGEKGKSASWYCGDAGILNTLQDRFDMICAFSVFTHVDLEDYFTHLQCMRRVLNPGGTILSTHLLLAESLRAKEIFTMSSALPYEKRRAQVLNIVASRELIETVAEMAGCRVIDWVGGEEKRFSVPGIAEKAALGQAIAVLSSN